jgi:chemotaxis protein histidine kinase CheA
MTQDDDFVKEFLLEGREGLDSLDRDLVALEENPQDAARFDSAFRSLHTIKGNSGFPDYHRLGELAHAGENVLQKMRAGEIEMTRPLLTNKVADPLSRQNFLSKLPVPKLRETRSPNQPKLFRQQRLPTRRSQQASPPPKNCRRSHKRQMRTQIA